MDIFKDVKFVKPQSRGKNPTITRRDTFVKNLQNQIDTLEGHDRPCRLWWYEDSDGVVGTVCFANSPIAISEKGETHFKVADKQALVKIYQDVMDEVGDGKWDKMLKEHSEKVGKGKKTA